MPIMIVKYHTKQRGKNVANKKRLLSPAPQWVVVRSKDSAEDKDHGCLKLSCPTAARTRSNKPRQPLDNPKWACANSATNWMGQVRTERARRIMTTADRGAKEEPLCALTLRRQMNFGFKYSNCIKITDLISQIKKSKSNFTTVVWKVLQFLWNFVLSGRWNWVVDVNWVTNLCNNYLYSMIKNIFKKLFSNNGCYDGLIYFFLDPE